MSNIPEDLRYSEDHEWIRFDAGTGIATIGITDYAQGELGDVVFLEFPGLGLHVARKDPSGTIEAVKTVADIYAPVAGELVEVNDALDEQPELVNKDPYGEGWMIKIKVSEPTEMDQLLDAGAYRQHIE